MWWISNRGTSILWWILHYSWCVYFLLRLWKRQWKQLKLLYIEFITPNDDDITTVIFIVNVLLSLISAKIILRTMIHGSLTIWKFVFYYTMIYMMICIVFIRSCHVQNNLHKTWQYFDRIMIVQSHRLGTCTYRLRAIMQGLFKMKIYKDFDLFVRFSKVYRLKIFINWNLRKTSTSFALV